MKWMWAQILSKRYVIVFICLLITFGTLYSGSEPLPVVLQRHAMSVPCLHSELVCWKLASPDLSETTDLFKYDLGEIYLVKRRVLAGNVFNFLPIYRDLYFLKVQMVVTKHDLEDTSGFSASHTMLQTRSSWGMSNPIPLSFLYPFSSEELNLVKEVSSLLPQASVTGFIVYDITNVSVGNGDQLLMTIVNLPKNVGGVKQLTLKFPWQLFHF